MMNGAKSDSIVRSQAWRGRPDRQYQSLGRRGPWTMVYGWIGSVDLSCHQLHLNVNDLRLFYGKFNDTHIDGQRGRAS